MSGVRSCVVWLCTEGGRWKGEDVKDDKSGSPEVHFRVIRKV